MKIVLLAHCDMQRSDLQRRACSRLAALVALVLILWTISCRPTWTSDGSKVVYPAKRGTRTVLAECEVATGTTRILRPIGPMDGAGVAVWDAKGAPRARNGCSSKRTPSRTTRSSS